MCHVHPVYDAGDSNPRPLEDDHPPIITRPGLPPTMIYFLVCFALIDSKNRIFDKSLIPGIA